MIFIWLRVLEVQQDQTKKAEELLLNHNQFCSGMDKTLLVFILFSGNGLKVLGGDLAKRLLGVGVICPKDSLVLTQPWHQGVF